MKTGGLVGYVHPYFEEIATVRWLNHTFGYALSVPEFLAAESPWDEWQLDMHFYYADAFDDPELMEKAAKHKAKFSRKGVFSALFELARQRRSQDE